MTQVLSLKVCAMKYYYPEHVSGYERIKAEGKAAWNEIHGEVGFENFSSRAFLEEVLPRLQFLAPNPKALEYGCGTGPGACFLAERGFQIIGIDLIPCILEGTGANHAFPTCKSR